MGAKFSTQLRNARSQQIVNLIDADANPGYIEFYTSPQPPVSGDTITTQTLLGTVTLSKPCGTVSNGILTFDIITEDASADATGDLAFGRVFNGAGTFVIDGDCGNLVSNAMFKFDSLTVLSGGIIAVSSGALTEGNV